MIGHIALDGESDGFPNPLENGVFQIRRKTAFSNGVFQICRCKRGIQAILLLGPPILLLGRQATVVVLLPDDTRGCRESALITDARLPHGKIKIKIKKLFEWARRCVSQRAA